MATRRTTAKTTAPAPAPSPATPPAPVTTFEVDSAGTLSMANFQEAELRSEFYEDVATSWSDSPQALADAMDDCEPLAWAVHSIYTDFRDQLEADAYQAQTAGAAQKARHVALVARLQRLPEEPYDGAQPWLIALATPEFEAFVVPEIERWFASPPDWSFEADHLPRTATGQGAALLFFQGMDPHKRAALNVRIVEGEHPGSTYYAAELRGSVDAANQAAVTNGVPVCFARASVDR
jgi:hypothetical protein